MNLLGNLVFFIFGGFILTIVGLPIAVQHIKLVKVALLPFGHRMRYV